jgi:plastocyanin
MEGYGGNVRHGVATVLSITGFTAILVFALVIPLLPTARSADVAIAIGDNFFNPSSRVVEVGDRVIWTNQGSLVHTVTSTTPAGILDSGNIPSGQSYEFTFTSEGTFNYRCIYHAMTGSITVVAVIPEFSGSPLIVAGLLAMVLGLVLARRRR